MRAPEQAGTIPFRRVDGLARLCLIRRRDAGRWGIPKGLVDPGFTLEDTALNETWEEAGLVGRLLGDAIGAYQFEKWGGRLTVAVFLLEVLEQERAWPEQNIRLRRWMSVDEALELLESHPVRPLLAAARERIEQHQGVD